MTKIHSGEDALTTYSFGNKNGFHKFCKVCGSSVMIFGPEGVDGMGVNVGWKEGQRRTKYADNNVRSGVLRVLISTSWNIILMTDGTRG